MAEKTAAIDTSSLNLRHPGMAQAKSAVCCQGKEGKQIVSIAEVS